jgi:predicted nucleotidyltransferase
MSPMEAAGRQWEVEEATLLPVLDTTLKILEAGDVEALLMGGIASAVHGRPRWTHDLDVFVRPQHARALLQLFADGGFATEEADPFWLFKATTDDVLVDIIFRSVGDLYLDEEMLTRRVQGDFHGRQVPLVSAEDLIVIKALAHAEHSPRHWHDALSIIARRDLDWDYLLRRARHGPRRMLSLLVYAQSVDLAVPDLAISRLYQQIGFDPGPTPGRDTPSRTAEPP